MNERVAEMWKEAETQRIDGRGDRVPVERGVEADDGRKHSRCTILVPCTLGMIIITLTDCLTEWNSRS